MIQRVSKNKTISQLFEDFQKFNQVKNLSESTIIYYNWNTKSFFEFLQEQNINSIENISREALDDFILSEKRKYSNSITINAHLRAIRTFLYYAMNREYLPYFKIHLIKQESKIVETYSYEDIQRLIEKPNFKTCSFVEHRNWIMVNYFIETGNRLRSVVNIKVSDVLFDERKIIIRTTKNRQELETPLTKTLLEILPYYIETWGLTNDFYLFPTVTGEQ